MIENIEGFSTGSTIAIYSESSNLFNFEEPPQTDQYQFDTKCIFTESVNSISTRLHLSESGIEQTQGSTNIQSRLYGYSDIDNSSLQKALKMAESIEQPEISNEVKRVLSSIQSIISYFQIQGFGLNQFPHLHESQEEDGSYQFEWMFEDFRIGFSFEPIVNDSGWFFVSNNKLNQISASGYIGDTDVNNLIIWIFSFILSYFKNVSKTLP
ncbi:MAG: hypothetical protein P9X24_14560 [Candidatus Hatepunaea meridiana]|nr:hypothetical protein [Candidatus Hatepunaea meridiana]